MQSVPGLSMGLQAGTAMFEGVSQSNADRGAAAMDDENARLAELQGALDTDSIKRRGRAVQGEAIAALGADGGDISGGSAQDLIYQNSLSIEYAALSARYNAANEARGYRFRAGQERQSARNAIIGGVLRAGAAAVTGIQQKQDRAREDAAYQSRYDAYFPGGQYMPVPPSFGGGAP